MKAFRIIVAAAAFVAFTIIVQTQTRPAPAPTNVAIIDSSAFTDEKAGIARVMMLTGDDSVAAKRVSSLLDLDVVSEPRVQTSGGMCVGARVLAFKPRRDRASSPVFELIGELRRMLNVLRRKLAARQ